MNAIDTHLRRLGDKLTRPCNLALLEYLLSFPERRLQTFTVAPFCTPIKLAALAKVRSLKRTFPRDAPMSQRLKRVRPLVRQLFRGGGKLSMTFIVFIAPNRAHRQYLSITSGRPLSPRFVCSDDLEEFYRWFGCLTERWPRGDDGFIPQRFVVDLGSYGSLGRLMMATPPVELRAYPVIFRGRNGDCAFMDRQGRFRWFGWQRGRLKPIADSFSDFLSAYIQYRSRYDAMPFEAAGRHRGKYYEDDLAGSRVDAALVDREFAQSGSRED